MCDNKDDSATLTSPIIHENYKDTVISLDYNLSHL